MPRIHLADDGRTLDAPDGANLMEFLDGAGVPIEHHCGGNCICGTCAVEVLVAGSFPPPKEAERFTLRKVKRLPDEGGEMRLACQHSLTRDITVRVLPKWKVAAGKPTGGEPS